MSSSTLVIFGTSDGILKIKDKIPELIKKYDTFGLNHFSVDFKTKYHMWIDRKNYGNCIYKLENNEYKPYLKFLPNENLFGGCTSVSFAIDFAIKRGYNKVILYGVLDGEYNLIKEQGMHCGHWIFGYRRYYTETVLEKPLIQLLQFKHFILSNRNKIEIEIPNRTF